MIAELGQMALILAFLVAAAQSVLPMLGASRGDGRLMAFGDRAAYVQCALTVASFALLTTVFLQSDFSVKLAAYHSHSAKPLLYKISGVWGNHEGSMLLWVLILTIFGALVPVFGRDLPAALKARALSVQGMIGVGFFSFILLTSNPFERLNPVPLDGNGLNPLLQDPGLAFHPPFLYLGYVGFSMAFSFSVAALIEGRIDAIWARWLRPWVLLAWSFLTIGITMGSVWAYYELGWGGWWMWDPVENVSFMPWLAGTALLHSILVLGTRHKMASWTVLLGIATFSLSLIGTFVVRSGVLVSVHAFAVDPKRGVYILALLVIATGGALALYALRAATLRSTAGFEPVSREGGLMLNNILLVTATVTVFLGTFYPLLMDGLTGDKISVGAPYFDATFAPIMCLLILFMGLAPLFKWRKDSLKTIKRPALIAAVLIALIAGLTTVFGKSVLGGLAFGLAAYLAMGTCLAMAKKARWGQISRADSFAMLRAQPAAMWGFFIAHMGMAIFIFGVTCMSVWSTDDAARLKVGDSIAVAGYDFTLQDVWQGQRDNYTFLAGKIDVSRDGKQLSTLSSERRFYPVREMVTTEAGFRLSLGRTVFASISEGDPENGWIIRAYYHPFVVWIWIGALMMALAGFISLADRRLRFTQTTPIEAAPKEIEPTETKSAS
ncbi:MAG: heme lyase CcmF/NrfE family subunit [Alphaproteobacteria bacterium]